MIPKDPTDARACFEREVSGRFGVMPNFFRSASEVPGLIEAMWAFTTSAYLDCPLPSLFKERLFVHLSRFCENRYCIIRHVGFLIGEGRPAGDPNARPEAVEQVIKLLQRPLPSARALAVVFDRLHSHNEQAANIPAPGTQAEYDLFDALTVMVVEPRRSKRAREAVRRAVGDATFEILATFIAFVRTAHFWTETHPELEIEPDMLAVLEKHDGLARLLLDPSDAQCVKANEALHQTLAELEDVKASLRVSIETLELALQSARQFAWEIDLDARNMKITGDTRSAFGFDLPANTEMPLAHVHPEDLPRVVAAREAALAGGPGDIEHRMINPTTGETIWVHSTGRLLSENGRTKLVGTTRNITMRKRHEMALREREGHLQVLVGELRHRTRNLMSVVSAIADKTLRTSHTLDDFKAGFRDRLGALARVQGLFFRMKEGDRVTFDQLLETELSAQSILVAGDGSVTLDGPKGVRLRSRTVQTLALVLHELVTNALKYGALKQPNGHLTVRWWLGALEGNGEPWLHFDWKESGVEMPALGAAPQGTGQGRELIEHALRYQFAAKTMFSMESDGIRFTASLLVSRQGSHEDMPDPDHDRAAL